MSEILWILYNTSMEVSVLMLGVQQEGKASPALGIINCPLEIQLPRSSNG